VRLKSTILLFNGLVSSWHSWQARSVNRQIFSAAVVVMAMTMVVKLLAAGREVVTAYYFGTGRAVDAFLVAFVLPSFAINVLAGSLTTSLMPVYIEVRENESVEDAKHLFSSSMAIGLVFLLLATSIMAAGGRLFLPIIGSGFDPDTLTLCYRLFYLLLPTVLLNGVIMFYSTALNADKEFALAAFVPAFVPVCAMICLVLFQGCQSQQVSPCTRAKRHIFCIAFETPQNLESASPNPFHAKILFAV